MRAKKLENGDDYLKVNPKGQVPALTLDTGELVTEGPVIVQMIADRVKDRNLAPARDTAERYKLLEWLNYITTELHKNLGPLFSPLLSDDAKAFFKDRAMGKFKYLETQLGYRDYLGALQRYRVEHLHDVHLLRMSSWLVDYPFADRLYPEALKVLERLRGWGQTVILSDGDVVFQPRKVERSGVSEAAGGHGLGSRHFSAPLRPRKAAFGQRRRAGGALHKRSRRFAGGSLALDCRGHSAYSNTTFWIDATAASFLANAAGSGLIHVNEAR